MYRSPQKSTSAAAGTADRSLFRWALGSAMALAVAYQFLLNLTYFLARAGVIHRDDWRHLVLKADLASWVDRVLWSDAGHVLAYSFLVQELGRAVFGESATFGVAVALIVSFITFLLSVGAVARLDALPVPSRCVLLLYLACAWLTPMGMFTTWGFGTAAILTSTAPIAVFLLLAVYAGTQSAAPPAAGAWAAAYPLSWRAAAAVFLGCALIAIASGGGIAVFPALFVVLYLLGIRWRDLLLFVAAFVALLAAIKLATGAPAATKGSFEPASLLGILGYPSGVLMNALGLSTSNFARIWQTAYGLGAIALGLSLSAGILALRQRLRWGRAEPVLAAGLGIAMFGYATGALISIGRMDFGLVWIIFPPRYATMQALIWTGLAIAYASVATALPRAALRRAAAGVWALLAIAIAVLFADATYRMTRTIEYSVMGRVRTAALMVVNGGADPALLAMLNASVDISQVYRRLKAQGLELATLDQARLLGVHLDGVADLPACEGRVAESRTLSDGTRVIEGAIRRPLAWRGIFTDTVASVDAGGDVIGTGGFVSVLPYASRKDGLQTYAPPPVQDLYGVDWILPRLLNQDVWFTTFIGPQGDGRPAALVYLAGSRPVCRLPLPD